MNDWTKINEHMNELMNQHTNESKNKETDEQIEPDWINEQTKNEHKI